jgi:general transcription factor 3C polypeptide 3 (transcription factor C subunit 4)
LELQFGKQEACYNLARALHTVGIYHQAIPYYQQALQFSTGDTLYDLSKEVSYNLAVMYFQSGATKLAKYHIDQIVIE